MRGARKRVSGKKGMPMILLLALLLVLLFAGVGFAVHFLWIVAVIFFVLWLVGFALGRGEGAGRHRFYRW
jgi:hypothetical protein